MRPWGLLCTPDSWQTELPGLRRASRELEKLVTLVQLFLSNKKKKMKQTKSQREKLLARGAGSRMGRPLQAPAAAPGTARHCTLNWRVCRPRGCELRLARRPWAHRHQLSAPVCQAPLEARGHPWEPHRPKLAPWRRQSQGLEGQQVCEQGPFRFVGECLPEEGVRRGGPRGRGTREAPGAAGIWGRAAWKEL